MERKSDNHFLAVSQCNSRKGSPLSKPQALHLYSGKAALANGDSLWL